MVCERPILFSAPMVRAILDGRKTQTRRAVKLPPAPMHLGQWQPGTVSADPAANSSGVAIPHQGCLWHSRTGKSLLCPHGQPGERLWVRETHAIVPATAYRASVGVAQTVNPHDTLEAAIYREGFDRSTGGIRWRPSIHMPRWACRQLLEVTDVRVERLQSICERDADEEGAGLDLLPDIAVGRRSPMADRLAVYSNAREIFAGLWETINGPGSWNANPWVWVIDFKRVEAANG